MSLGTFSPFSATRVLCNSCPSVSQSAQIAVGEIKTGNIDLFAGLDSRPNETKEGAQQSFLVMNRWGPVSTMGRY